MDKELFELLDVKNWRKCYIGYSIEQIIKLEEKLDFDEEAIEESREFSD